MHQRALELGIPVPREYDARRRAILSSSSRTAGRSSGLKAADRYAVANNEAEFNVIMDGRDIGTVVLPDADLKIFLTASAEERASRRYLELEDKPDAPTYEQLLEEIRQRDYNDTHRKIAPLKCAKDAVRIDSTTMGFHEVCEEIMDLVEDRLDLE